jgi:4-amino-4-deoxy-L-arabinose transferase-like glycosyltransferase
MGAFLLLFLIGMYFLPSVIAGARQHRNSTAIAVLNIMLGWTVLGWVISLVWAFTNPPKAQVVYLPPNESGFRNVTELEQGPRQALPQTIQNPNLKR